MQYILNLSIIIFKFKHIFYLNLFILKLIAHIMSWFANMQVYKSKLVVGFFIHTYYWTKGLLCSFQKCWHPFPINVVRHYNQVKGSVSLFEVVFSLASFNDTFYFGYFFSQISLVIHPSGPINFKNFSVQITLRAMASIAQKMFYLFLEVVFYLDFSQAYIFFRHYIIRFL